MSVFLGPELLNCITRQAQEVLHENIRVLDSQAGATAWRPRDAGGLLLVPARYV